MKRKRNLKLLNKNHYKVTENNNITKDIINNNDILKSISNVLSPSKTKNFIDEINENKNNEKKTPSKIEKTKILKKTLMKKNGDIETTKASIITTEYFDMPEITKLNKRKLKENQEKANIYKFYKSLEINYNVNKYNFVKKIQIKLLNNFFNICVDAFFKSTWVLDKYVIQEKVLNYNKNIGNIKENKKIKDMNPLKTGILDLLLPDNTIEYPEIISTAYIKQCSNPLCFNKDTQKYCTCKIKVEFLKDLNTCIIYKKGCHGEKFFPSNYYLQLDRTLKYEIKKNIDLKNSDIFTKTINKIKD